MHELTLLGQKGNKGERKGDKPIHFKFINQALPKSVACELEQAPKEIGERSESTGVSSHPRLG